MAADSHQLIQFAIENDDRDLIHLILINERVLHQQAKGCAVSRQLSTPKNTHYMSSTCVIPDIKRIWISYSTALRHANLSSVRILMRNKVFCYRFFVYLYLRLYRHERVGRPVATRGCVTKAHKLMTCKTLQVSYRSLRNLPISMETHLKRGWDTANQMLRNAMDWDCMPWESYLGPT